MNESSILVIGAGELGLAIVESLAGHPSFDRTTTRLAVLLRGSSLQSTMPEKVSQRQHFHTLNVDLVPGDIDNDSLEVITQTFSAYNSVIHAAGMASPSGTMTKVTKAVLKAGVGFYIPWQHGVDYDVIGREGGQGLFIEQIDVRDMLRAQTRTRWVIISCGIFMSFLFEEFWGVVGRSEDGMIKVTALNSWDDWITTTTADDIGRCTAELLFMKDPPRDKPVYIAGDTLTYAALADIIGRVTGKEVVRDVWSLACLREASKKDPSNKLKKYRVVFSEGQGLSWLKADTWNAKHGIEMEDVAAWVKANLS